MKEFSAARWLLALVTLCTVSGAASAQPLTLRAAHVSGVTGQWGRVSFGQTIADPIVMAGPLSYADPQPAGVRVRNVTPTGFEVQAQEWDAQDGVHGAEQLSYVAIARGRHPLSGGKVVVAESTTVTGGGFQSKTFSQPFATVPIILATVVTQNEASAVAVQIRSVTSTGFQIRLREQEANAQAHVAETVHFLAWEPGSGVVNGLDFHVGAGPADQNFAAFAFSPPFAAVPWIVAGAQTTAGQENFSVRSQGVGTGSVQMRLQEDDSFDTEFVHVTETIGYLAIAAGGGGGNQAPNGVINTPASNVTITVGQSVNFTGTGTDPENNVPLTYLWNFGGEASNSTQQNPGAVVFNAAGTFTVTFTVTDSLGLSDSTPATRTIQINATANQAPNGVINTPASNVTITVGQSVNFTGTGSDPDNNLPLTYLWDFGTSEIAQSTQQDPGSKVFNTAGTFTVTFTVTDSLGLADSTPATRTLHIAGALDCARPPDQGTPACIGQWTPPFKWGTTNPSLPGTVAVHLSVLPNGKVFGWSRGGQAGGGNNGVEPVITWDPITDQYIVGPSMDDLFCSGHAHLPDGRLLVSGGVLEGAAVAAPYDWKTGTWGTAVVMNNKRYYPSVCPLGNGEQLVIAGGREPNASGAARENTVPQVWKLDGTFRDLTGASFKLPQYPWVFLAPDGRVFIAGPLYESFWLNTSGTGELTPTGFKHGGSGWPFHRSGGVPVMYGPGKILTTGGARVDGTTGMVVVTPTAEIIDLNQTPPVWRKVSPMADPTVDHMLILLPDGTVFKVGGTKSMRVAPEGWASHDPDETKAVLSPQIWSPSTTLWRTVASMQVARMYHSAGVLLPDGRVLVGGGGKLAGFIDHPDAEIYSPPYLFMGARPTINGIVSQRGNDVVQYGESFTVMTSNTNITRATLTRLPSMSHSLDWNQRFNELTNVVKVAGGYQVIAPPNGNVCPPGHYYLHLLNDKGVPSVARIIQIPVS